MFVNNRRNVQSNVNKAYINEWLDEEKEKLDETAEDLKKAYRKDAERVRVCLFYYFCCL